MIMSLKVYPNGNTLAKMHYRFKNYGEYNIGYLLAPEIKSDMIEDGFRNVKNWYGGNAYHITGEKYGTIDMLMKSGGLTKKVSVDKNLGITKQSYVFNMEINNSEVDKSDNNNYFAGIMRNHIMIVAVELPGIVEKTNGKRIGKNKIKFTENMYNVLYGSKDLKYYVKSSVSMKDQIFNATVRAENRLSKLDGEINNVTIKIEEMSNRLEELKEFNNNASAIIKKQDKDTLLIWNRLVRIYRKQFNIKPQTKSEIVDFFERKGVDEDYLPRPISGTLVFDKEKNIFKIKYMEEAN